MSGALHLTIATPMDVLVEEPMARLVRAEDGSGSFGILPGHCDFLTVLPTSVVRWIGPEGRPHFCALRAGMLTVEHGTRVAIACREGVLSDDLAVLEAEVGRFRTAERDAAARARVEQMRLHANAVRQIMRILRPDRPGTLAHPPAPFGPPHGGRS